jgi:hypothetical protein
MEMNLTKDQVRFGYWKWSPESGWPPKIISNPEDYAGGELLSCTPTQISNCTPYQQKKITRRWCEAIPRFESVRVIWFHCRVTQDLFDAACSLPKIEAIYIKWSGIKSLRKAADCRHLRHLHVGSSTQVESIEPLARMTNLLTLSLESLKRIQDYSPLEPLVDLQGLSIDGSMWTTQKIKDLEFVKPLKELRFLTLINTRLIDKSFDPILNLANLERFDSSWNYPESEFEKLKSLPNLRYGNVETSWKQIKLTR